MSDLIWLHDAVNVADIADYTGLSVEDVKKVTDEVVKGLKALQTVDAVPVVRCAECKYLDESLAMGGWDGSCRYWNTHSTVYSGFCSFGEKKVTE